MMNFLEKFRDEKVEAIPESKQGDKKCIAGGEAEAAAQAEIKNHQVRCVNQVGAAHF